jgi:hypothetical protein
MGIVIIVITELREASGKAHPKKLPALSFLARKGRLIARFWGIFYYRRGKK